MHYLDITRLAVSLRNRRYPQPVPRLHIVRGLVKAPRYASLHAQKALRAYLLLGRID